MQIEQLEKDIELQREENIRLYNIFQYRLHEEEMQPIIKKWRDGSMYIKQLIAQRNQLVECERKSNYVSSERTFVNGYGEATEREITSTTYIRSDKRLSRQVMSFIS